MGKYFGTDGVRGKANIDLTCELAFNLGKYGGYRLKELFGKAGEKPVILIGRDTRLSGTMLEAAFSAGATSVGVDIELLDIVPTASVAYLTNLNPKAVAGVVISASHNPACDNGIKFFGGNGYKLPDEVENSIEELMINEAVLPITSAEDIGIISHKKTAITKYISYLISQLGYDLSGMKIGIDGANGSASFVAPIIFAEMDATYYDICCEPNGININDKCGSTYPETLGAKVRELGLDVGIAFDGDADRLIVVDENGSVIDGDKIMAICAIALKNEGKLKSDNMVITIMSNMGLKKTMAEHGINVYETTVGDRYVLEKLKEIGGSFGGEQSGHIIFKDINTTGDGIISAMYFLKVLKESGKKASEYQNAFTVFPQVLKNVYVKTKVGIDSNEKIQFEINKGQAILEGTGRIVIRPSGTESLIRVMAEGEDLAEITQIVDDIAGIIEKELN